MYINIKIYVIYHNIKILYSIIVHCIVLFYAFLVLPHHHHYQKEKHFPYVSKDRFVEEGYVAKKSGHSKGSTVDMTLIKIDKELNATQTLVNRTFNNVIYPYLEDGTIDCGTSFDLMDPISHGDSNLVSSEHKKNRDYIKNIMNVAGFDVLDTEWWYFTFRNEPYPNKYFDFDVE